MKAIIMAGGEGSRLRPITCTKPKPMVKLLDKPVIEYTLSLLKKHQITEVGITARYMPDEIISYFGDGSDFGVSISYFVEKTPLGTAGSVKNALSFIDDTFLVISGDALTDIDISDAIEFHKKNSALATLVLKHVDVPLEYGVVVTDKKGRVTRFIEKPNWGEVISDTVNTGIYILEPEIFESIEPSAGCDFSCDLFPRLLHEKKPIYGYNASGYWCDIGDIFAYMSCQHDMLTNKVDLQIHAKQLSDGIYVGENVTIEPNVQLSAPIYIGNNVHIGEGARISDSSVIESGAHIGNFADIKKSIVGSYSHVGAFSQLRACVIGEKTVLKPSACVFEQSVVGDMCRIGEGSIVKPSIKLWPNKTVDAHTQVQTNLVWEKSYKKTLFDSGRISGEVGIDLTPESVSKLGASFGALLNGGRVAVSSCPDASADMMRASIISGLMSSGCEVYDCSTLLGAMTRFAIRFYNLDGGVHISTSNQSGTHYAKIDLMDTDGCDISTKQQRKLENLYEREDFVRAEGNDIKKAVDVKNYREFYIRDILNRTVSEAIEGKILVNTQNPQAADIISRICTELGAEITITHDEINSPNSDSMHAFAKKVKSEDFLFGAALDMECENLMLCDENGRILDKADVLSVDIIITLQTETGEGVVMPISAPRSLAQLAEQYGKKVIYTKIENTDFMRGVAKNGSEQQFVLHFDGVGAILRLLVFLAENEKTLSEVSAQAEQYFLTSNKVYCAAEHKGSIIKHLIDDYDNFKIDLTDGIKIFDDKGWVLVVPDSIAPSLNVISEGVSIEAANELAADMIERIKQIEDKSK